MGFIQVELDGVKEPEAVPEGNYDLRIVKAEDTVSKKGNEMTVLYIKIEDDRFPDASILRHWITYPDEETPSDQRTMRLLDLKRLLKCFGVPHNPKGFDTEDLVGQTGTAFIRQEEADDGNIYNRLVLPRLGKADRVAA